MPEVPDAPPDLSSRDLLVFCCRLYPTWDGRGAEERLARFGVDPGAPFGSLSKGQKGHVSLALALAHHPDLLVLDDPTLGLDAVARKAFFEELITDLSDRGASVFLASHDLGGIEAIAERVVFLKEGRVLLDEPLESLKARFRRLSFRREAGAGDGPLALLEPVGVFSTAFGEEAVVSAFGETPLRRLLREHRRGRGGSAGDVPRRDLHRPDRRRRRCAMKGYFAVVQREWTRLRKVFWMVLFAAFLEWPLAYLLRPWGAEDVLTLLGLIFAAAFGPATAMVLGSAGLAADLQKGSAAFDFSRPVSSGALFFGRMTAAAGKGRLEAPLPRRRRPLGPLRTGNWPLPPPGGRLTAPHRPFS